MFNIGAGELMVILVVALIVLGPSRLPELARGIGKFMREFRRQTDDVRNMVEREFYRMDQEFQAPAKPAGTIAADAHHTHEGEYPALPPVSEGPIALPPDLPEYHPEAAPSAVATATPTESHEYRLDAAPRAIAAAAPIESHEYRLDATPPAVAPPLPKSHESRPDAAPPVGAAAPASPQTHVATAAKTKPEGEPPADKPGAAHPGNA